MTDEQRAALVELTERFNVPFDPDNYRPTFDLPSDWVAGWVGPIYVGVDPEGRVSS